MKWYTLEIIKTNKNQNRALLLPAQIDLKQSEQIEPKSVKTGNLV